MSQSSVGEKSCVIPCLKYRNAPAAIEWLCDVFGFEKQLVVPGPDGTIAHSQLRCGGGMIMVGSVMESPYSHWTKQPDEVGGTETQFPCLIVADADAVYAKVLAAGGRIAREIHDEDYGGRGFGCYDLEGHMWYVGTYNPWT